MTVNHQNLLCRKCTYDKLCYLLSQYISYHIYPVEYLTCSMRSYRGITYILKDLCDLDMLQN